MTVVLDASMAVSFLLADEFTAESERILAEVARGGAVVPPLWDAEVLNALRSAEKRGRLTEAATTRAVHGLTGLPIERDRRTVDGVHVLALARQFDLSAYDAVYLWLAMEANLPLATTDQHLRQAATASGVALA